MNTLVALVAGYLLGARTGGKELDRLGRSLKALCATDEFDEVVSAARAHVGSSLRDLAGMIDGERRVTSEDITPGNDALGNATTGHGVAGHGDLVSRVRELVGRD